MDRDDAVTVVIPVGSHAANQRWLNEAMASCREQGDYLAEILLIDDMASLMIEPLLWPEARIWASPWRLGVAAAFNFGVALARSECVFLLGSDDVMLPGCLEACWQSYEEHKRAAAYYYVPIRYMDTGEEQGVACGEAMVTKQLWRMTGGFPVEMASGAPDAGFVSILMAHYPDQLVKVGSRPLVEYRRHNESDTAGRYLWQDVILRTRALFTEHWEELAWMPQ